MEIAKTSGLEVIAQFEKRIKYLKLDVFGLRIIFDDKSEASLLPTDKMLEREMEFVETYH